MTLSSGIFRTLVASLILLLTFAAVTNVAQAREIRIFPVPAPAAPCVVAAFTACDLVRAAAGLAPTTGPDAGVAPGPGDTLVLGPGTYTLRTAVAGAPVNGTGPVVVPGAVGYNGTAGFPAMENLKIRSRDGANVTIITEAAAALNLIASDIACVIIGADGVELGGPGLDQGVTVRACGLIAGVAVDGVQIGTPAFVAGPLAGTAITPAGQADEHLTIQNNILLDNAGNGVNFVTTTNLDTMKAVGNNFRNNALLAPAFAQLRIGVGSSIGTRGPDRNVVIENNTFDGDQVPTPVGIAFVNVGTVEQTAILNNRSARHAGIGLLFGPTVTDFEDSVIAGNFFQQNGIGGVLWANIGRIENVKFTDNRGTTIQEGITGNGVFGALAAPSVTDIRDSEINNNNFNSNGGPGLALLNATDFETSTVVGNSFRQNGAVGQIVANTGDQDEILYGDNEFRNNTLFGQLLVATVGRIQNQNFDNNRWSQNSVGGLFVFVTSSQDLETTDFVNGNLSEKNGGAFGGVATPVTVVGTGISLIAAAGGDVGEVNFDDLSVLENTTNGTLMLTTTGDVTNITGTNSRFDRNGGQGLSMQAVTPAAGAFLAGDADTIDISNTSSSFNGTRTNAGFGSGFFFRGDNVDNVTLTDDTADSNNDHGAQWSSNSDLNNLNVQGGSYNNNDQNVDSVGNGLDFSSNDTANNITVNEVETSGNNSGVRFNVAGRTGRDLVVSNSTLNNNRDTGAVFFGSEDLDSSGVQDSTLNGNQFGINFTVNEDGSDLFARGNDIIGDNGQGTGVLLDASRVDVSDNSIRKNNIGIEVRKMEGNGIHNNNIARNEEMGIDATALSPGESVDATGNWYGEPSGPKHATNPNGIGDRVSDKVDFSDFLTEPAVPTDVNFQIVDFSAPDTAAVDTPVAITATIKNNGTEEGSQSIQLKITGSDFVDSNTVSRTINPSTTVDVDFNVVFPRGGTFTVTLTTQNDSAEQTIEVTGPTGLTIEAVCDSNDNNRIDDDEILACVELWVTNAEVPGTGQTISDSKILFLIELWVTNGDISTLPASASAAPKSAGWLEALVGLFSPAVKLEQHAQVTNVAAGDSFTVTTTLKANNSVQGLLLSEQLPAGWTISEVTTAGGFFKPSENKWLWLGGNDITVTYTVNVPASAAAGSYDIVGSLNTMDGFSANNALRVNVSQSNVLSVSRVAYNGSRFVAEGTGITAVDVQVYALSGSLVFSGESAGNTLSFSGLSSNGQVLSNGVYLYVVTAKGVNGQLVRTSVGKLVILR